MNISETSQPHLGWSPQEDALLFERVRAAREQGAPLKNVFEQVAELTGRKPNSIRNYYYVRVRQGGFNCTPGIHTPAFVPFTPAEIQELLTTVLGAQAKGMSVRACTLSMGNGDNRAMLRYQNKYRSLIKNDPELVRRVMADMQEKGVPTFDPYAPAARRAGRPRGSAKRSASDLLDTVGGVVNDLNNVQGLDVSAFFESLGTLAIAAAEGAAAKEQLRQLHGSQDHLLLLEENRALKSRLQAQRNELSAQQERFNVLLGYFRQLMNVNREFLGLTSVVKVSSLSTYIRSLSENMENCEKYVMGAKES